MTTNIQKREAESTKFPLTVSTTMTEITHRGKIVRKLIKRNHTRDHIITKGKKAIQKLMKPGTIITKNSSRRRLICTKSTIIDQDKTRASTIKPINIQASNTQLIARIGTVRDHPEIKKINLMDGVIRDKGIRIQSKITPIMEVISMKTETNSQQKTVTQSTITPIRRDRIEPINPDRINRDKIGHTLSRVVNFQKKNTTLLHKNTMKNDVLLENRSKDNPA